MSNTKSATLTQKKYARLETICEIYDLNLKTWRKKASRHDFPGIIRRRGERRLYIDIEAFDRWFKEGCE